jgi:hypothetical protein
MAVIARSLSGGTYNSPSVGPILTDQRNALPHGAPDLCQQFAKSVAKPRIPEFASGAFSINPVSGTGGSLGRAPRGSILQIHGAPLVANQVLSNESQAILLIQDFRHRLGVPQETKLWVIESFTGGRTAYVHRGVCELAIAGPRRSPARRFIASPTSRPSRPRSSNADERRALR